MYNALGGACFFSIFRGYERCVPLSVVVGFIRRFDGNLCLLGRPVFHAHTAEELPNGQPAALVAIGSKARV
jgi:hypothetical protein